jgi:hypothetical protein
LPQKSEMFADIFGMKIRLEEERAPAGSVG